MSIAIILEFNPHVALNRRLSEALRMAIREGRLKRGDRMPSVRELAETLKISRATVLKAYKDLHAQGLTVAVSGSGTVVAGEPSSLSFTPDIARAGVSKLETEPSAAELSRRGEVIVAAGRKLLGEHVHVPALEYGGTPIDLSPMRQWRALMLRHCDLRGGEKIAEMIEPTGIVALRQAIADYVQRRRSISCDASNICLFGAKQLRLELIGRLLVEAGDLVAYEEPGYPENRHSLESMGAVIVPVQVDAEGISISALRGLKRPPKLIYVSPSHQDPLGVVMSMQRRIDLLAYAASVGAFIVEDDFDSDFRYGKPALPSLKSLDRHDCVIYMASFWKVLYQSLRLSFVIFPHCLQDVAALGKGLIERHLPLLDQLALVDFINDGHLEAHIKNTQKRLAVRRQCLILAVTRYLKPFIVYPFADGGGTHILLDFRNGLQVEDIERSAREAGFNIMSTQPYYQSTAVSGQFIVPFGGVDVAGIDEAVRLFAANLSARTDAPIEDFAPPIAVESGHVVPTSTLLKATVHGHADR
jgi:GntR family transcriptional regulator / MocR family aminotransferase